MLKCMHARMHSYMHVYICIVFIMISYMFSLVNMQTRKLALILEMQILQTMWKKDG